MEYLVELKRIYKDIVINKYNKHTGIQTEEDLILVLKSTQLLKDKRKEIIELWREDPIHKLEQKYGKETLNYVFKKKKEDMCEEELNEIFLNLTMEEKFNLLKK
jgi:hypothetical protein